MPFLGSKEKPKMASTIRGKGAAAMHNGCKNKVDEEVRFRTPQMKHFG
jgi:hypothetical protein